MKNNQINQQIKMLGATLGGLDTGTLPKSNSGITYCVQLRSGEVVIPDP